ncbi:glycosyltransferase family 39 protein [Ferriphaselus sp. R-1]|uniref:glycosyltransferase family 39 protein n=1 Tax=Ferriphaselus sp. R-1 TaxID=1485544 RepID=UPI00055388E0|nr:glycosyltransferase family 39 protein [Ferriphaselus sp. R-1]
MKEGLSKRGWWLLILVAALIWFSNLEYRLLAKPDEGRYAEIPREMVASGDWVTPRLNDLKYFEKPPLQYWATAVAYEVFGEHQWTSRLWAALTGFLGLWLTWFTGARLFGRTAASYATVLLGSSLLYVGMAHINTLDMGVTFFVTLGLFAMMLAQRDPLNVPQRRGWMLLAWAAMALAVLSKGLMGIILPGTALLIYIGIQREWVLFKRLHLVSGVLLFFAICAPWFYLVMKANPEFFQRFFIYEHYTRFTTKDLGRYQPWYYFVPILLLGLMPWTLLMFDTLLRVWRNGARAVREFSPERFLLVWIVFVYVFFSASGSKLPSYLLPMFPPLALLMGQRLALIEPQRLFRLLLPMLALAGLAVSFAPMMPKLADYPEQMVLYTAYARWLEGAALIWLATLLLGSLWLRGGRKFGAVLAIALGSLLAYQVALSGYNAAASERNARHIAQAIQPLVKPDMPLYQVWNYEQTIDFYLKRTFTLVQFRDELAFGIDQEPERWIADLDQFAPIWNAHTEALALMPVYAYPVLQKRGFPMRVVYQDYQFVVVSRK